MLVFNHYRIAYHCEAETLDDLLSGYASILVVNRSMGSMNV